MYTAECYNNSTSPFMVEYSDSKTAQMLVSRKDGGDALSLNPLEFKLFVRAFDDRQGCQITRNNSNRDDKEEEDSELHQLEEEKQEDNFDMLVSSLKVNFSSAEKSRGLEEDDEGLKTPTSLDQKITVNLKSPPPAPRKPKSLPLKKRKANRHPRLLLDLSSEIESLFPPVVLADLGGGKIKKKARQASSTNDCMTS